jgi:hypothetical protein
VVNKIVIHGHESGSNFMFFTTMATMDRLVRISNSKVMVNQAGYKGGREFTMNRKVQFPLLRANVSRDA